MATAAIHAKNRKTPVDFLLHHIDFLLSRARISGESFNNGIILSISQSPHRTHFKQAFISSPTNMLHLLSVAKEEGNTWVTRADDDLNFVNLFS